MPTKPKFHTETPKIYIPKRYNGLGLEFVESGLNFYSKCI